MVCRHCVRAVTAAFDTAGIAGAQVSLGHAVVPHNIPPERLDILDRELAAGGFARITDHETATGEKIRHTIIGYVRNPGNNENLSTLLSTTLAADYSSLSRLFSAVEHRTIEKYTILQRIEFVKELLDYRELNISEIAHRAGYSSTAHLSRQFKAITGQTPTEYLRSPLPRIPLNSV